MKGYKIKIIRHGKTQANKDNSYIGITDLPLCEDGKAEILQKTQGFYYGKVQKVYSSPLKRCTQTAELIFPNSQIHKINELGEMSFGDFEGKTQEELRTLPEYKNWLAGGLDNPPPNGESLRQVMARVFEGLSFIIYDMMENQITDVALVTHGAILMNIMSCFGVPKLEPTEFVSENGEGFEIYITAEMWQRSQAFEIMGIYPYNQIEEE